MAQFVDRNNFSPAALTLLSIMLWCFYHHVRVRDLFSSSNRAMLFFIYRASLISWNISVWICILSTALLPYKTALALLVKYVKQKEESSFSVTNINRFFFTNQVFNYNRGQNSLTQRWNIRMCYTYLPTTDAKLNSPLPPNSMLGLNDSQMF